MFNFKRIERCLAIEKFPIPDVIGELPNYEMKSNDTIGEKIFNLMPCKNIEKEEWRFNNDWSEIDLTGQIIGINTRGDRQAFDIGTKKVFSKGMVNYRDGINFGDDCCTLQPIAAPLGNLGGNVIDHKIIAAESAIGALFDERGAKESLTMEAKNVIGAVAEDKVNGVRFSWRLAQLYVASVLADKRTIKGFTRTDTGVAQATFIKSVSAWNAMCASPILNESVIAYRAGSLYGRDQELISSLAFAALQKHGLSFGDGTPLPPILKHMPALPGARLMIINIDQMNDLMRTSALKPHIVWDAAVIWHKQNSDIDIFFECLNVICTLLYSRSPRMPLWQSKSISIALPRANMRGYVLAPICTKVKDWLLCESMPAIQTLEKQILNGAIISSGIEAGIIESMTKHMLHYGAHVRREMEHIYRIHMTGAKGMVPYLMAAGEILHRCGWTGELGRIMSSIRMPLGEKDVMDKWSGYLKRGTQWEDVIQWSKAVPDSCSLMGILRPMRVKTDDIMIGKWYDPKVVSEGRSSVEGLYSLMSSNYGLKFSIGVAHVNTPDNETIYFFESRKTTREDARLMDWQFPAKCIISEHIFRPLVRFEDKDSLILAMAGNRVYANTDWYIWDMKEDLHKDERSDDESANDAGADDKSEITIVHEDIENMDQYDAVLHDEASVVKIIKGTEVEKRMKQRPLVSMPSDETISVDTHDDELDDVRDMPVTMETEERALESDTAPKDLLVALIAKTKFKKSKVMEEMLGAYNNLDDDNIRTSYASRANSAVEDESIVQLLQHVEQGVRYQLCRVYSQVLRDFANHAISNSSRIRFVKYSEKVKTMANAMSICPAVQIPELGDIIGTDKLRYVPELSREQVTQILESGGTLRDVQPKILAPGIYKARTPEEIISELSKEDDVDEIFPSTFEPEIIEPASQPTTQREGFGMSTETTIMPPQTAHEKSKEVELRDIAKHTPEELEQEIKLDELDREDAPEWHDTFKLAWEDIKSVIDTQGISMVAALESMGIEGEIKRVDFPPLLVKGFREMIMEKRDSSVWIETMRNNVLQPLSPAEIRKETERVAGVMSLLRSEQNLMAADEMGVGLSKLVRDNSLWLQEWTETEEYMMMRNMVDQIKLHDLENYVKRLIYEGCPFDLGGDNMEVFLRRVGLTDTSVVNKKRFNDCMKQLERYNKNLRLTHMEELGDDCPGIYMNEDNFNKWKTEVIKVYAKRYLIENVVLRDLPLEYYSKMGKMMDLDDYKQAIFSKGQFKLSTSDAEASIMGLLVSIDTWAQTVRDENRLQAAKNKYCSEIVSICKLLEVSGESMNKHRDSLIKIIDENMVRIKPRATQSAPTEVHSEAETGAVLKQIVSERKLLTEADAPTSIQKKYGKKIVGEGWNADGSPTITLDHTANNHPECRRALMKANNWVQKVVDEVKAGSRQFPPISGDAFVKVMEANDLAPLTESQIGYIFAKRHFKPGFTPTREFYEIKDRICELMIPYARKWRIEMAKLAAEWDHNNIFDPKLRKSEEFERVKQTRTLAEYEAEGKGLPSPSMSTSSAAFRPPAVRTAEETREAEETKKKVYAEYEMQDTASTVALEKNIVVPVFPGLAQEISKHVGENQFGIFLVTNDDIPDPYIEWMEEEKSKIEIDETDYFLDQGIAKGEMIDIVKNSIPQKPLYNCLTVLQGTAAEKMNELLEIVPVVHQSMMRSKTGRPKYRYAAAVKMDMEYDLVSSKLKTCEESGESIKESTTKVLAVRGRSTGHYYTEKEMIAKKQMEQLIMGRILSHTSEVMKLLSEKSFVMPSKIESSGKILKLPGLAILPPTPPTSAGGMSPRSVKSDISGRVRDRPAGVMELENVPRSSTP